MLIVQVGVAVAGNRVAGNDSRVSGSVGNSFHYNSARLDRQRARIGRNVLHPKNPSSKVDGLSGEQMLGLRESAEAVYWKAETLMLVSLMNG